MKTGQKSSFVTFKSLLMGCALGSAAFVAYGQDSAQAQSSLSLQPVSGWAVSRVGDVSTNEGYCALARRFSNSHVVTIAQNKQQEASFAFDFQRPDFNTNRSYAVTLSAGGYSQDYDILAKSQTGLVIKTGRNEALFNALEQTQKLSLSVDGKNYDFMFSGFKSGREQLEQCLGFTVERVREQYSSQMSQVQGQMSELRDELAMLRSENQSLLSQMDSERSKYKDEIAQKNKENAQIDALMAKLSKLEDSNVNLSSKLRSEQTAKTDLQGDLNALIAQKNAIKANADKGLKAALEQARRERVAIEQKYSSNVGQLKGQMSELRDELGMLQNENQTLLSQLENERTKFRSEIAKKTQNNEQIDELMDKLTSLENNNTQLMQKLQNEQSAKMGLQSNLDKLIAEKQLIKSNADEGIKAAVTAAQKERDELRAMLAAEKARRAEIEKIVAQKDNIEKQQSELVSRISELEEMNVELGMMLDTEEAERRKMEAELEKAAASKSDYNRILNENKSLRQSLEAQKQGEASSTRVDELNEKLAMQQSLVSQKDKEAEAARQSLFETKARLERLQIERNNLMSMLERERDEFSKYMKQEGGGSSKAMGAFSEKLAALESKNATLMRELQEKEEKLALQSRAASGESVRAVALQNRQADATEAEIAELKQMLAMERDERMRLARMMAEGGEGGSSPSREAFDELAKSFQSRIAKMESENSRLRSELQNAHSGKAGAVVSSVSQKDLREAQLMIAQKKQELDVVSAERDELRNLLGQEKARRIKMAQMLSQKKDVTTQKTELNGRLRALEARNVELSRALAEAKKNAVASSAGVRTVGEVVARPPITASAGASSSASMEVAQIKNDLEIALAERDEYRKLLQEERARLKEVQSLRARIGSVQDDQKSLNDTISSLQKEKNELQRALNAERERLAQASSKPARVETKVETKYVKDPALKDEIDTLRAERDALRSQIIHENKGNTKEVELLERMVNAAQKDENELRARVSKLEQEKQELNSLLSTAQRDAEKARGEVARYASSNESLNSTKLQAPANSNDAQRISALEEENRRLYTEMKALKAQKSEVEALEAEVASIKAQNAILKEEISDRKQDASKVVADEDMIAHLRGTIDRLSLQNENLEEALKMARARESQIGDENPYREKLMNAETRIQAVMAENASLARELEKVRLDAEKSLISGEQTDMNMELATARYKEAEREIDRLSQILKEEREKHRMEVADLEDKLFDPAITDAEQLRKLDEMKREIARLQNIEPAAGDSQSYKQASQKPRTLSKRPDMIDIEIEEPRQSSGIYIEVENELEMASVPVAEVKAVKPDMGSDVDFSPQAQPEQAVYTQDVEFAAAPAPVKEESSGYKSSISKLRERLARNNQDDELAASYAHSRYYAKAEPTARDEVSQRAVKSQNQPKALPEVSANSNSYKSGRVDFQPVPQAEPVPQQRQNAAIAQVQTQIQPQVQPQIQPETIEPASGMNMAQAIPSGEPVVMNMQRLPRDGETIKEVAPIMDGPGEAQLASAIQSGGGVFVSERQVVIQPEQPAAPVPAPAPAPVAAPVVPAPVSLPSGSVSGPVDLANKQPRVIYQMQPLPDPVKPAQPQVNYQQPAPVQQQVAPYMQQQAPMQMAAASTVGQAIPQQMAAPLQPQNQGPDGRDIASLLIKAGIPMVNGFEKVSSVSNERFAAFRWDTGSVYGSAEKTYMPDMSQFQNFVDGYLRKTEARCTGSFDKTSYGMRHIGGRSVIAYDIACVGGDMQGAGAALLFYAENNSFNVIAHESGIEGFDTAMNTRDTVSSALSK